MSVRQVLMSRTQFRAGPWLCFLAGIVVFSGSLYLLAVTNLRWLLPAASLVCLGVVLNRFVLTIQTLAVPTLPFDSFMSYSPSWQETCTFLAVVAYGVLVYSFSFRYLPLFPQERDLQAAG